MPRYIRDPPTAFETPRERLIAAVVYWQAWVFSGFLIGSLAFIATVSPADVAYAYLNGFIAATGLSAFLSLTRGDD